MSVIAARNTDADEDAKEDSGEQLFDANREHEWIALHGKGMLEECDDTPAEPGRASDERCDLRPTRIWRPTIEPDCEREADRPEYRRDDEN